MYTEKERIQKICSFFYLRLYTLASTPYALHPTPYTLHSTLYTLHPTPYAHTSSLHRASFTLKLRYPAAINYGRYTVDIR